MNTHSKHRIVIVGGGVAGLEIAASMGRRWRGGDRKHEHAPSVILVDRDSAHVWKPMLHTIAAGTRDVSQQQTTYVGLAKDAGFSFQPGELAGLNRKAREIMLADLRAPDGRFCQEPGL
ncbi:MAG: hypothetical protein ABTQ25_17620 [Nitrosomonas ureae]